MMYGGSGMWGFWLFSLILVVGAVLLIVVAVRVIGGGFTMRSDSGSPGPDREPTRPSSSRAQEILDERYASGDLSTEEYRERTQALHDSR